MVWGSKQKHDLTVELLCSSKRNILDGHEYTLEMRNIGIHWLMGLCESLNFSDATLFSAVSIMDMFCQQSQSQRIAISEEIINLLTITSVFIASKYEEIHPLSLDSVEKHLGENEFSKELIKLMEIKILRVIGCKLSQPNLFHKTMMKFKQIESKLKPN